MTIDNYQTVPYGQEDGSGVAEIPAISGCLALMETRAAALAELGKVFELIAAEYRDKGLAFAADHTEILHA